MNVISRLARGPVALGAAAVAAALMFAAPLLNAAEPAAPSPPPAEAAAPAEAPALQQPPFELPADVMAAQQALAAAEQAALQDPALKQLVEGLDASLQAEMRKADPEHDAKIKRLGELEQQLTAAQAQPAPDMTKMTPLITEAQGLQQQLVATQTKIIEAEPMATRIADLQKQVLAKMTEIDPKVPAHIARLEQLSAVQ